MGIILASMMCIDLGGPINKAAYAFTVGLLTTNTYMPMAATMAGGMVVYSCNRYGNCNLPR